MVRELSYDEMARYGTCEVCGAKHGQPCDGNFGIALGRTVSGGLPENGVHLARLRAAPRRVMEVPA